MLGSVVFFTDRAGTSRAVIPDTSSSGAPTRDPGHHRQGQDGQHRDQHDEACNLLTLLSYLLIQSRVQREGDKSFDEHV